MSSWPSFTADVNDVTIGYVRTGRDKPPALLLHGLMGAGATWTPVARLLEAELDVVMPDARGHGRSSAPSDGYRYSDLADDVIGLIEDLPVTAPLLVGHSMGGMTAALVAARAGHLLGGLVLVDPTFLSPERQHEVYDSDVAAHHTDALSRGRATLLEEALSRHPRRSPELVELQVRARMDTSPAAIDILRPPNPPYRDLVAAIEVPTLLVIGDRTVVTPAVAAELRDGTPHLQVRHIAGAGHGLPFDRPQEVAACVLALAHGIHVGS